MALFRYFGTAFLLHLVWENVNAHWYAGYVSFAQHFWMCFFATATGDMLFMLTIYLALALAHRAIWWIAEPAAARHPATWGLPLLIGGLLAVSFELWAVYVAHRWAYATMPLIPVLRVGVSPVLQAMLVPLAAFAVATRGARRAP